MEKAKEMETLDTDVLRSRDGLVETRVLRPRGGNASDLVQLVRDHWTTLRAKGLAEATPIQILLGTEENSDTVVYVFKWKSPESRTLAEAEPELVSLTAKIQDLGTAEFETRAANEVYQGFDWQKFPDTGGLELLKGKCTCVVKLEGVEREAEISGLNGFVLMHRAPGRDVDKDGRREMYVSILDHGTDCPTPLAFSEMLPPTEPSPRTPEGERETPGGAFGLSSQIRVGQNKELPQYGLIRAQSDSRDFPATAMWVVHWRIWTSMGSLITDPAVPLVFGPTTVFHYPPVGTEFHSQTGPVRLIHEPTGETVGTLTPRQLTAFDIVVTKDDEITSEFFDYQVPPELVELFNSRTV